MGEITARNFLRPLVDPRSPRIDIVAVHGLNPFNTEFHAEKTWTSGDKLWLRDFLPAELPQARVLLYGYNSNVALETSIIGVREVADNLLNRLHLKRRGNSDVNRPIIFIAHSLGGIIVKQALIEAKLSPNTNYQALRGATYGLVFFATPHQGGNYGTLGDLAAKVVKAVLHNPNNTFMEALKKDSLFSNEIVENFKHQLEDYRILSFYESIPLKTVGIIVDKKSATLGLPGSREQQLPLEADHSEVCKFVSPSDSNYEMVIGNLSEMVENALKESSSSSPTMNLTEAELNCLQSLYSSNYKKHKLRNHDRVDGTCEWFLKHAKYVDWVQSKSSSLLWFSADAGCGKSVLSAFIIDQLFESFHSNGDVSICYFFFKDDNAEQYRTHSAFSAILHQILVDDIRLLQYAMKEFQYKGIGFAQDFYILWDIINDIVNDAKDGRSVICILDGLDECEEKDRAYLLEQLQKWYFTVQKLTVPTKWSLKFLITSRPSINIVDTLYDFPTIRLRGEDETEAISQDIELVVQERIAAIGRRRKIPSDQQQTLIDYIIKNADHTFLWASITLERIEKSARFSRMSLQNLLHSYPVGLDGVYDKILNESENLTHTKKILKIVLASFRPLTTDELNAAFVICSNNRSEEELDLEPDIESTIKKSCGIFLRVNSSTVYLIHQTAREFLFASTVKNPPTVLISSQALPASDHTWKQSFQPSDSHRAVSHICKWYLLLNFLDDNPLKVPPETGDAFKARKVEEYTKNHMLLTYAARYWPDHLRLSGSSEHDADLRTFAPLQDTRSSRFQTWFQVYWNSVYPYSLGPKSWTPLILAAYFGQLQVIKRQRSDENYPLWKALSDLSSFKTMPGINARDDDKRTALSWAACNGYTEVVRYLLEFRNIEVGSRDSLQKTPLMRAVEKGHLEVVDLFLSRKDVVIDAVDDREQTTLWLAAFFGQPEIVKRLLSRPDVAINKKNKYGESVLFAAAWSGSLETVKLLLARPDIQVDYNRKTPIIKAAERGNKAMMRMFLEYAEKRSAKFNISDALYNAAENGHTDIVRTLLNIDPELLNAKDKSGFTPLALAARRAKIETVRTLLEFPNIDVNASDPLHWAISWGLNQSESDSYEILRLLLERPDINVYGLDCNGDSVLSVAAERGNVKILGLLLQRHRQGIFNFELNVRRSQGLTPLCWAICREHPKAAQLLLSEPDISVNQPDDSGHTPLIWAAWMGQWEIVQRLLERQDIELEAKDNSGRTAVEVAREHGHPEIAQEIMREVSCRKGGSMEKGRDH